MREPLLCGGRARDPIPTPHASHPLELFSLLLRNFPDQIHRSGQGSLLRPCAQVPAPAVPRGFLRPPSCPDPWPLARAV